MFDFRWKTLFCLEKRLSKHKMTMFSKHYGGSWPFWPPPGYAYGYRHPRHPDRHNYFLTFYRVLASGPPTVTSGLPSDKLWPEGSLQITPLAQTSSYATGGETWLTNIIEIAPIYLLLLKKMTISSKNLGGDLGRPGYAMLRTKTF